MHNKQIILRTSADPPLFVNSEEGLVLPEDSIPEGVMLLAYMITINENELKPFGIIGSGAFCYAVSALRNDQQRCVIKLNVPTSLSIDGHVSSQQMKKEFNILAIVPL